jgi:hypothetical protein
MVFIQVCLWVDSITSFINTDKWERAFGHSEDVWNAITEDEGNSIPALIFATTGIMASILYIANIFNKVLIINIACCRGSYQQSRERIKKNNKTLNLLSIRTYRSD